MPSRPLVSFLSCFLLAACEGKVPRPDDATGDTGSARGDTDAVAEITAVRGPGGLVPKAGPAGTFLGASASLQGGVAYEVPSGTLVELRTRGGATLRLDEGARVILRTDATTSVELEAGRLLVMTPGAVQVNAGGDVVAVERGEVQIAHEGPRREVAVVHGHAVLRSGGREMQLGAGATVVTPLEETAPTQPQVGLRPLDATAWARAFDDAAALAADLPRGVGSLEGRRAGSNVTSQTIDLVEQSVHVSISGRIARTEIEQTFHNRAGEQLEGIYRFPLPADASISGLQLLVGNRWMEGAMLEKERARQIFKEIVDATIPRDPALLQWEHGNVFKLRIFPIPAHGERKIRLAYTQVLPEVGDTLRYRYPIGGSGASGRPIDRFAFAIDVDREDLPEGAPLSTPMLPLERRDEGDRVVLGISRTDFLPAFDLGVDLPLTTGTSGGRGGSTYAETHLDRDGQAYFMTVLHPDLPAMTPGGPTSWTVVVDRSHGTTVESWAVARGLWEVLAQSMAPEDHVAVLACDTACDAAPGGLAVASPAHLQGIGTFLDGQTLAGASDVGGALERAAETLAGAPGRRVIVYLGDGAPSAGILTTDGLRAALAPVLRGIQLEAVAIGSRSDLLTLETLTGLGGGGVLLADARDDLRGVARELQLRAHVPALRDVELELPPGLEDVHPRHPTGVRPDRPIRLVGRIRHPVDGVVRLRARDADGRELTAEMPLRIDAVRSGQGRHAHLPRTWAHAQVEHLTATRGAAARDEIVRLSQAYTVLSRWTALLVLENDAMYREFGVARRGDAKDGWDGAPRAKEVAGSGKAEGSQQPASSADSRDEGASLPSAPARDELTRAPQARWEDLDNERRPDHDKASDDDALGGEDLLEAPGASPPPATPRPSGAASSPEPAEEKAKKNAPGARRPADPASSWHESGPAKKPSALEPVDTGLGTGAAFGGGGGLVGGGFGGSGRGDWGRRPPQLAISDSQPPGGETLARIDRLLRDRDAAPARRSAHARLVGAALAAGHADALEWAKAWAAADPDHPAALRALASLLAATGDGAALRAYASAVDVQPFQATAHERLAEALQSKGDTTRTCAHRRALVSLDPRNQRHHAALAACRTSALPRLGRGDVTLSASWSGGADLDIAVVDGRGKRRSILWSEGVDVAERPGSEELVVTRVSGPLAVEITRFDGGTDTVRGDLRVHARTGATRIYPFELSRGTLRLAKVRWD